MIIVQLDSDELSNLIQNAVRKAMGNTPCQTEQTPSDELLTVPDTAKFLTLSVPTIYGLIAKGELPVMKRSKRCYFSKIDLINYLKEGRNKTRAEIASEENKALTEIASEANTYVKIKSTNKK